MFPCSRGVTNPSVLHCPACMKHIVCLRGALTISRLCMVCQAWQTQTPELWKGTDTHIYPCGCLRSLSIFSRPRPHNWSSVLMSTKWTTLSSLESFIRSLVRWESWVFSYCLHSTCSYWKSTNWCRLFTSDDRGRAVREQWGDASLYWIPQCFRRQYWTAGF